MRDFIGRAHPAAKIAWFVVALILLAGLLFTGFHNVKLYARGLPSGAAQVFALAPALMLDGSIAVLLILLLTWFKDGTQWLVAAVFNLLLFVIVGANTILDYNLANGAPLNGGMLIYLRGGIVGSFLLAFAMWEVLIHLDPVNKRRKAKGALELQAENALHGFEVALLQFELEKKSDDLEYERKLHQLMHSRRIRAAESDTVEAALDTYESREAAEKARRIRGEHGGTDGQQNQLPASTAPRPGAPSPAGYTNGQQRRSVLD
jgi:hypothetical protein